MEKWKYVESKSELYRVQQADSNENKKRERDGTNQDTAGVITTESYKGSRKESLEEEIIACPSLLVLRQEDGAVRPEKRKSLRYATDSRSWRYKASLPRKNKIALKEVKGKARQVEKIAVEREDGAVHP